MLDSPTPSPGASDRSRTVALVLAAIVGPFGGHRFYAGRSRSGLLMLATLGGAGIWWLYDLILVASGSFRDINGRLITRWEPEESAPAGSDVSELHEDVNVLRAQVAELAERLDFAERLLAQPRPFDPAQPSSLPR